MYEQNKKIALDYLHGLDMGLKTFVHGQDNDYNGENGEGYGKESPMAGAPVSKVISGTRTSRAAGKDITYIK